MTLLLPTGPAFASQDYLTIYTSRICAPAAPESLHLLKHSPPILHFFPSHPFFKQVHSLHKSVSVSINSKVGQLYEPLFSKTLGIGNYTKCKKSLCYCLLRMISRRQKRTPSVSEEDNVGCISSSHVHPTSQSFFWVFMLHYLRWSTYLFCV